MKIIDAIKKACKEKGIPEKYAERILKAFKIEKEEQVEGFVDVFKENLLPAITEAETESKAAAEKLSVAEYEKKYGLKDGKLIEDPNKGTPPATPPAEGLSPELKVFIEAQTKQIADLTTLVTNSTKTIANTEKSAKAKVLISSAKLPEAWANRINLDSETSVEDQVTALTTEYTVLQQDFINKAVETGQYAPGAAQPTDRSVEDWAKLMDNDAKPNNPGVVDLGI